MITFLAQITWGPDPEIVNIFGVYSLRYYSLLFGLGVFFATVLFSKFMSNIKGRVIPHETLLVYIILGIVLGARIGHCLFYEFSYYASHPLEMILPIQKIDGHWQITGFLGLASHGGVLGVIIAVALFARKYDFSFLQIADRISLVAILTGAFIRFGNFMNSEILGVPTDGAFGVIFKRVDLIPRHPSQLYESICYTIIFLALFKLRDRILPSNGLTLGLVLILVFSARFIIEFTKIDQVAFEQNMQLNMGQLLSIPFVSIGILLVFLSSRPKRRKTLNPS